MCSVTMEETEAQECIGFLSIPELRRKSISLDSQPGMAEMDSSILNEHLMWDPTQRGLYSEANEA